MLDGPVETDPGAVAVVDGGAGGAVDLGGDHPSGPVPGVGGVTVGGHVAGRVVGPRPLRTADTDSTGAETETETETGTEPGTEPGTETEPETDTDPPLPRWRLTVVTDAGSGSACPAHTRPKATTPRRVSPSLRMRTLLPLLGASTTRPPPM